MGVTILVEFRWISVRSDEAQPRRPTRCWTGFIAILAMVCGLAHAALHLANSDHQHFSPSSSASCLIASIDAGAAACPPLAIPSFSGLSRLSNTPAVAIVAALPHPWRARAPPSTD